MNKKQITYTAKKHVSGPWHVRRYGGKENEATPRIVGCKGRIELATMTLLKDGSHEWNASLISAAPDLLGELQRLVDIICGGEREVTLEDCDAAKAAITKATTPMFVVTTVDVSFKPKSVLPLTGI